MTKELKSEIKKTIDPNALGYSMLWEDHKVLEDALLITPSDNVLSITSSGCNVLSLLLQEPRSITAIDLNPAQNHLFNLKLTAIKYLEHNDFLSLFGFSNSINRIKIYQSLEDFLEDEVKVFWDANLELIEGGICHQGKLEKYFLGFINEVISRKYDQKLIKSISSCSNISEQKELCEQFFSEDFKKDFINYFGQENQSKRGRDKEKYTTLITKTLENSCTFILKKTWIIFY